VILAQGLLNLFTVQQAQAPMPTMAVFWMIMSLILCSCAETIVLKSNTVHQKFDRIEMANAIL